MERTTFKNAWGYQGDAMRLPVADADAAKDFYTAKMGFEVTEVSDSPRTIVFARPDVEFAIVENGGDPSQDGCAFEVADADAALAEFRSNGLEKLSDTKIEERENGRWKVFYVIAPDGLCYWIGERLSPAAA